MARALNLKQEVPQLPETPREEDRETMDDTTGTEDAAGTESNPGTDENTLQPDRSQEDRNEDTGEAEDEEITLKNYRYTGPTIDFFKFRGVYYTLHPGAVALNVPAQAPQVMRHVKKGLLTEV